MEKKTKTACCCGGDDDQISFLPEDYLIQEILVRLPVVSLLRFKSVCKSWLALIQTPFFIDLHTTTSNSSSNKFGTFILHAVQYHYGASKQISEFHMLSSEYVSRSSSEYEYEYGGDWYWGSDGTWHKSTGGGGGGGKASGGGKANGGDWHWDDTTCGWCWVEADDDHQVFTLDDDQLVLKLDYLGFPPIQSLDKLSFNQATVGSCNGLICLYDFFPRTVSLWNPATRQFRRLPKSHKSSITIEERTNGGDFVLFGFDVKTKDYKVLLIITYLSEEPVSCGQQQQLEYLCRVQVYSLSTNSWRLLEGINSLPGVPLFGHYGVYLNNGTCFVMATAHASHPAAERKPYVNRFIISFDFTKEIFTTKQFPDLDDSRNLFLCCLGGEKMALFTTLRKTTSSSSSGCEYDGSQDCDIWVLNEQGSGGSVNKESWNKLHSFRIKNIIVNNLIILRSISNDGKFALLETMDSEGYERMLLYNLVTKEAKMDFLICHRMSKVYDFKPSLVSIIGGNGAAADAPVIG